MPPGPRADDLGNRGSGTSLGPVLLMPGGDRCSRRTAAIAGAATQGAIVPFPRSRLQVLAEVRFRRSGAAVGLIWTPLLSAAWSEEKVAACGRHGLLQSAGQRGALAPSYGGLVSAALFSLAGQILPPDGGTVVND
jgi:hypothetical protein